MEEQGVKAHGKCEGATGPGRGKPGDGGFHRMDDAEGARNLGRAIAAVFNGCRVILGQTLKRSESLGKAKRPGKPGRRSMSADHEVAEPRGGGVQPIGREGIEVHFERLANRKRGGQRAVMHACQLGIYRSL
jgi:hypothetical protein